MIINYKYMKYLDKTDDGYILKKTAPDKIKKEIKKINKIYEENYGEKLIKI